MQGDTSGGDRLRRCLMNGGVNVEPKQDLYDLACIIARRYGKWPGGNWIRARRGRKPKGWCALFISFLLSLN